MFTRDYRTGDVVKTTKEIFVLVRSTSEYPFSRLVDSGSKFVVGRLANKWWSIIDSQGDIVYIPKEQLRYNFRRA